MGSARSAPRLSSSASSRSHDLDRVEPGDVLERERRLDEVEQALALALDQVLLDPAEPRPR